MKTFISLNELNYITPMDGLKAKIVHSESQSVAFWEIEKGAVLPSHSHPHEQISMVSEGKLELTIGTQTEIMSAGMVAIIPSNVEHKAKALSPVEVMDVFYPVREDLKPNL